MKDNLIMELSERLREVFDVCDTEKCGLISVSHLVDLAREHFAGGDQKV